MNLSNITKKIRLFSLISFIIPLITLNSCLAVYKILGNYYLYPQLNWDQVESDLSSLVTSIVVWLYVVLQ